MKPASYLPKLSVALIAAGSGSLFAQSVDEPTTDRVYDLEGFTVTPLEQFANQAIYGETPISFSEVGKEDLDKYLASQDIPIALNFTPSVYATNQGGGAGDARINIRGFDQRNVAVMINGVPVNDMENGWVYWSNWDGVGDIASSVQVQRGISNLDLAVPSIGGTLNIMTSPAGQNRGGMLKQEFGSDGFSKTTLIGHTGLINDRFAASAAIARKMGGSYIDGVWTDAWSWYMGASLQLNEANTIEFYGFGAPQKHGQNLYQRNIATYSESTARSFADFDEEAFDTFYERGFAYNETWNYVDASYTAPQADHHGIGPRRFEGYINERENFYDKPQVSANWYFRPEDSQWSWDNVLYYSGGEGGGTGTYGSVSRVSDFGGYFHRNRDWDAEIAQNQANLDSAGRAESTGILRNSRNNQYTIGLISKATYEASENWTTSFGLDWRTAEIQHFREVRDLLGGDYYLENEQQKTLGGIIDYNNTNTVDWLGGYWQAAYEKDDFSGFGMIGLSQISYSFQDDYNWVNGAPLIVDSDTFDGMQLKLGGRYNVNESTSVYANLGYVEKVPIFDNVIDDGSGEKYLNPPDEIFVNYEIGVNYTGAEGKLTLGANYYRTNWDDRAFSRRLELRQGEQIVFDEYVNISGVNQRHQGLEFEGSYRFNNQFSLNAAVSLNDWEYTNDVTARVPGLDSDLQQLIPSQFDLYIAKLKVGDAPQTQFSSSLTYTPQSGMYFTGAMRYNADNYSSFDPLSRTNEDDRIQSWKAPDFTVFDFHAGWKLPTDTDIEYEIFASILNVFDEEYIQDATDSDSFSGYHTDYYGDEDLGIVGSGDYRDLHDADSAAVHFGAPRRFNAGIKMSF
ncbi:TonB-dependent receptor plug domain-containing protein [Pelagicoccus enzymogenes]|uniref:TonB-dependent receptor n=1 Tax=Pelagicoccus enzymogenes TaxID=2773457 RepID=UPI00280D6DF4|nr:TonB-dependent receptor plug domain-containing protein [Pelagicoccus enzymogenes]MDQ8197250.1 TonB-dependent receptor plug domain-containing protein [Pelagicoccus enzymogenes]